MHPDKDLQLIYITEVTKKDILAGLDLMALPIVWISEWDLDTLDYQRDINQKSYPPKVKQVTLDQAVRILYQTDELNSFFTDFENIDFNFYNVDFNEPFSGAPAEIILKLNEYLKSRDDNVATFIAPHLQTFYVAGFDRNKTQDETNDVWAQTVEDLDDLLKNLH